MEATVKMFNQADLIKFLRSQAKSTDMWLEQWNRYKDTGGVRNAALAIGKMMGIYQILLNMNGADENMPEEVIALMKRYMEYWDDLHICPAHAQAIANVAKMYGE